MSNYLIKQYPKYYEYFKEEEFTWDRTGGDPIKQGNRNPLLYKNIGADGIKTGYLGTEKYSLAASIIRNERRLISVASGFENKKTRSKQSLKLLTWGMTNFDLIEIYNIKKHKIELDVWLGKKNKVDAYIKKNIYKTIPKARKRYLKVAVHYDGPINAPIEKDQKVGKYKIFYKDNLLEEHDVFALEDIEKVNIFSRLLKSINFLIWGDV